MEFSRCLTKQRSKPFSFCKRFYVNAIYSEQFHKSIWCKEEIRRSKYFQKRGLSLNNRPLESFLSRLNILRERIILPNTSFRHPIWPYSEISPLLFVVAVKCVAMQKHIVIKPARSCSGNKTRLKAFAGLATDRIWRTPIHETGGELDVRLDEFYLWCEAKTIFRSRGTRLVHRHAKKRG